MQVRIYRPSKAATQSGFAGTHRWVLEYEPETPRRPEPLMGWTSSADTLNQVKLHFESKDDAVAYAKRKGLSYTVENERERRVQPRSYSDNFKPRPKR